MSISAEPNDLSAAIAAEVEHALRNPSPVLQGITKRALRRVAEEIAQSLYGNRPKLKKKFLAACKIDLLKEE